jgi:hypothetical protein
MTDYFDEAAEAIAPRRLRMTDPVSFFRSAGFEPDPMQAEVLRSEAPRLILNVARQSGKSRVAGALAAWHAQSWPRQTVLLAAARQEQAKELLAKARQACNFGAATEPYAGSHLVLTFGNGSRIIAVPTVDATVRGYSADLVIIDEASRVEDEFFEACLPMLGVTRGRLVLLSTPWADNGFFYEVWTGAASWDPSRPGAVQANAWHKIIADWTKCPRIDPYVVEELRRTRERAYLRDYLCQFLNDDAALFNETDIAALWDDALPCLSLVPR